MCQPSPPPLAPPGGSSILRATLVIKTLQSQVQYCLPVSFIPASAFLALHRTTPPFVRLMALKGFVHCSHVVHQLSQPQSLHISVSLALHPHFLCPKFQAPPVPAVCPTPDTCRSSHGPLSCFNPQWLPITNPHSKIHLNLAPQIELTVIIP